MTMIDLVSKKAHFILTHTTITAENTVRLFLHKICENSIVFLTMWYWTEAHSLLNSLLENSIDYLELRLPLL